MKVLSFVNDGNSTLFPIELAVEMNETTEADIAVAMFYEDSIEDIDPDVASFDIDMYMLGGSHRFDIGAYRRLRSLLSEFDILHTHTNSVGSMGRLAAAGTGVTIVNTEHNDHRHFSHLQNWVNCPTYPLVETMILNSNSTRESFRLYERPFLSFSECQTVYNGIDFDRIDASLERDDLPSLPEGPKIVTAAVMREQKNLTALLDAMVHVLNSVSDAELILIGDGPRKSLLERRARELGIQDSTTFLGYLPEREQVYGTVAKCEIFAVTSIFEGFCNAAVEAMGVGLPVVVSDIDVLREVVGEGGRFTDQYDPADIGETLQSLLEHDDERQELGETARRRARETFPIERTAEGYVDIYSNATVE